MSFIPQNGHKVERGLPESQRPLAVLIGWIGASEKNAHKYGELYRRHNMDALVALPKPSHVLDPKSGRKFMADLIEVLETEEARRRPLIFCGFSVGGYMFGNMLLELQSTVQAETTTIPSRCVGQVFDSVVDFEGIPFGLSTAVFPKSAFLQRSFQAGIEGYLRLFADTNRMYSESSAAFHANFVHAPALWVYCENDPVAAPANCKTVISKWRENNVAVDELFLSSSAHVEHFRRYPEEYQRSVDEFVSKVKAWD